MGRKKIRFLAVPITVGFLFAISVLYTVAGSKHVIILLDTSGSMGRKDEGREAIQWAEDVCALSGGLGFHVSLVTFQSERIDGDAIKELFQQELPDENNMKRIEKMLDRVKYNGLLTDHKAALERAASILEPGQESDTAIVMLSDGELDYVNSSDSDREPTEEEKKAIDCFQEKCRLLAGTGCNIYLVGFGNDVKMFQELNGDNGIVYFSKDDSPLDIMERLLADNGYMLETGGAEATDGDICFQIDKDYYQSIIYFEKSVENMAVEEEDVSICCDGEKKDMDISVTDLSGSAYLYLKNPCYGRYEIKTGNCLDGEYCVWNLEKYENITFEVSLLDGDGNELVPNEKGIYEVETDMMPVKFLIQTFGNIKDEEISNIYYEREVGNQSQQFSITEKKMGRWIKEVELPDQEGTYSYKIVLEAGGISGSKEITIARDSSPCIDVEEENETAFVEMKYDLKNDKISQENIRKEKVEVYIDSKLIIPGTADETAELGEDLTIIFHEPGEHHINIRRNGCTVRKIKYTVKIWPLKEALPVCVVLLLLVLLLVCIFRRRRQ